MKHTVVLVLLAGIAGQTHAREMTCEQLKGVRLQHAEITAAAAIAAGSFTVPANPAAGGAARAAGPPTPQQVRQAAVFKALPAFCRLTVISRPTRDSQIGIEVWLPETGWTGRLAAGGNGGFQSAIPFGAMADGLGKGYAVTGTDTGHQGNDESTVIGHPEKVIDWDNRAVHEMAVVAKALIAARYGRPARYSYFNSCSTGGRQAEVAAEYFPNDFDGIVAGAPANPMTRLQAGGFWSTAAVTKEEASFIPAEKWSALHRTVVEQCDAVDGLKDGLVDDPRRCHFDVNTLLCKAGDRAECLTPPQIEALNKITAGLKNPRTGEQLYPGWPFGTPMFPGQVAGKTPDRNGVSTFRAVYQDANWDYHTFDFDRDLIRAEKIADKTMNAVDESRLGRLFAHGGKLLLYHGWLDPNISSLATIEYYDKAVAANGGVGKTYDSVRLFMIPEMYHCGGGDGPSAFDKLDVISAWVEQHKAPDLIVASHSNAQGQVDRTRPLCPYPQVARYKGSGNIDEAQNFSCTAAR